MTIETIIQLLECVNDQDHKLICRFAIQDELFDDHANLWRLVSQLFKFENLNTVILVSELVPRNDYPDSRARVVH